MRIVILFAFIWALIDYSNIHVQLFCKFIHGKQRGGGLDGVR